MYLEQSVTGSSDLLLRSVVAWVALASLGLTAGLVDLVCDDGIYQAGSCQSRGVSWPSRATTASVTPTTSPTTGTDTATAGATTAAVPFSVTAVKQNNSHYKTEHSALSAGSII